MPEEFLWLFDQGLLSRIYIGDREVFKNRVLEYGKLPLSERMTPRTMNILEYCEFEMLDIHLYDNVGDWDKSILAYKHALSKTGKAPVPLIVSEFGGPWPTSLYGELGKPSPRLLAESLIQYVQTLDQLPVETAFFFKLNEDPEGVYHDDSFLINRFGKKCPLLKFLDVSEQGLFLSQRAGLDIKILRLPDLYIVLFYFSINICD